MTRTNMNGTLALLDFKKKSGVKPAAGLRKSVKKNVAVRTRLVPVPVTLLVPVVPLDLVYCNVHVVVNVSQNDTLMHTLRLVPVGMKAASMAIPIDVPFRAKLIFHFVVGNVSLLETFFP